MKKYVAVTIKGQKVECNSYAEACDYLDICQPEYMKAMNGFTLSFPPLGNTEVCHCEPHRYRNYTNMPFKG